MKKIEVSELHDNVFATIGKEWMLIAAGTPDKFNMMTASWGCLGWLWNKPVAVMFVRPERYTHEFVEREDCVNLVFLGGSPEARKAYAFCGSHSGRDCNKAAECGLTPVPTESGCATFAEARLTLECRKMYKTQIRPEEMIDPQIAQWYGQKGGLHDVYVMEITNAYAK